MHTEKDRTKIAFETQTRRPFGPIEFAYVLDFWRFWRFSKQLNTVPNFLALFGAGFSRNWGGWLAPEAFEYLLGSPEVGESLRNHLWWHKRRGGFESALADLQDEHRRKGRSEPEPRLRGLQDSIVRMFADMDKAFASLKDGLEFSTNLNRPHEVKSFLSRFDAIFTLNQDLLLERHYFTSNLALQRSQRTWDGWDTPGVAYVNPGRPYEGARLVSLEPYAVQPRKQPYFKLHGSSHWKSGQGSDLLVVGAKLSTITNTPLLKWYYEQFVDYLTAPNTRLLVIGYSFGDDHINSAIREAAKSQSLSVFVIDPLGVDVMDKNRDALQHQPDELAEDVWPFVIGASRRTLREIFSPDPVEWNKVMRFFDT